LPESNPSAFLLSGQLRGPLRSRLILWLHHVQEMRKARVQDVMIMMIMTHFLHQLGASCTTKTRDLCKGSCKWQAKDEGAVESGEGSLRRFPESTVWSNGE